MQEKNEKRGTTVVVTNQKGGVGKSTVCRNLSDCLYARGHDVLMIDFDTQGNLSYISGIKDHKKLQSDQTIAYPFLKLLNERSGGKFPRREVKNNGSNRLDIIPANKSLFQITRALSREKNEARRICVMRKIVSCLKPYYDYIIVDTPPTISDVLMNAIAAADEIVMVTTPEMEALDGVIESYETVKEVAKLTKTNIGIAGVVINDFTTNRAFQDFVIQKTKAECDARGLFVFDSMIPRAACVGEANASGLSIAEYKNSSDKAIDSYNNLVTEFLKRDAVING